MNILDSQSWDDWGREVPSACDLQPGSSTQNKNNDTEGAQHTPPSSSNQGENTTTEKSPGPESISEEVRSKTTGNEQHRSVDNGQVRRKRGRPRLKAKDGEASIQQRRMQIRRAQQTHRLKKETTISTLQKRVSDLEGTVRRMDELFCTFNDRAVRCGLQDTEPELAGLLRDTASRFSSEVESVNPATAQRRKTDGLENSRDGAEAHQSSRGEGSDFIMNSLTPGWIEPIYPPTSPYSLIESHLSSTPVHTYSFLESSFSRRLHRYCLEHAYRYFSNPGSDPKVVYRLFRLVSCMRDQERMARCFRNLVRRGPGEPLEIWSLPFYRVGGAGTHYPREDECGNPTYPPNMRVPRRILGSLPVRAPEMPDGQQEEGANDFLWLMGFGGEWFDSYDVEKYLEEKGIFPDAHLSSVEVKNHSSMLPLERSVGNVALENSFELSSRRSYPSDCQGNTARSIPGQSSLIFDIERFLNKLLQGVVILGRAPGFRRADVDAALLSTLRVRC